MNHEIDIQNTLDEPLLFTEEKIEALAHLALKERDKQAILTLRFVTTDEIKELNHTYRQQNKPTNVLAFPSALPPEISAQYPLLGDVIICPEVLLTESKEFNKSLESHWSLIIIHGILHLLGYDHIKDEDATIMQSIEIHLLAELGYENPYDLEGNQVE